MKVIRTIFSVIGIGAIALITAMAFKVPNSFKELFGIYDKIESDIQSVPYFVNFGDLGTSDSIYKTQYFNYANRSWYLAWGNHGGTIGGSNNQLTSEQTNSGSGSSSNSSSSSSSKTSLKVPSINPNPSISMGQIFEDENGDELGLSPTTSSSNKFNMLLGWNSTKAPVYGGYSYEKQVMSNIPNYKDEGYNYSYLIMDFDFELNHKMDWSFSAFENLSSTETKLYLITSHTQGQSWEILSTLDDTSTFTKGNELKFSYEENSLFSRTTRYGLVLVSKATSCRIEMNLFKVDRLSLV